MSGAGRYAGLWAALILGRAILTPACALGAPPPSKAEAYVFDIPSQSLMSAVETFAATTGIQVLYDRPVGGQLLSPGVHGRLSSEEALKRLLAGTGLTARFTDPGDVVLEPLSPPPASPPPDLPTLALSPLKVEGALVVEASGDDTSLRLYAALIRNGVQQALAETPKTAKGDYTATLDLWIGPKGEIVRARLGASSGNGERDKDILAVVQKVTLGEPPPPDLPQPIRVSVRSRHL